MNVLKHFVRDSLFIAAGASPATAKNASPADRIRIRMMGATVVIPVVIAFLGAMIAFSTAYEKASLLASLGVGALAGLFVLCVELMINASLAPGKSFAEKIKPAVIRFVISLLLSATLAMPVKLFVFSGPLRSELMKVHNEELDRIRVSVQANLQHLENSVARTGEAAAHQSDVCRGLYAQYVAEVDHSIGGRQAGHGPVARQKLRVYQDCMVLSREEKQVNQQARDALLVARNAARDETEKRQGDLHKTQTSDLISQMLAWKRLSDENTFFSFYGILVFCLLTGLDLLPTLVKLSTQVPSYQIAEARALLRVRIQHEAELQAGAVQSAMKAEGLIANEAVRQRVVDRRRKLKLKAMLADVAYEDAMLMERKMARQSIYDDPEFKRTLDQFTDAWLGGEVALAENKNTDAGEVRHEETSIASPGDNINIVRNQRCTPGLRAPCRSPVLGYRKKTIID